MRACCDCARDASQQETFETIRDARGAQKNAVSPPFLGYLDQQTLRIADLYERTRAQTTLSQFFRCGLRELQRTLMLVRIRFKYRVNYDRHKFADDGGLQWLIDDHHGHFAFIWPITR